MMRRHLLLAAIFLALASGWTALRQDTGDPPKEQPKLTAEQQAKLAQRDQYGKNARTFRKEGKLKEAIEAAEKMLAIEREILGNVHEDVAGSLELLAEMHEKREAWDAARKAREEVVAIVEALYGREHFTVTDAILSQKNTELLARLTRPQRHRLAHGEELNRQVIMLYRQGKPKAAIPSAAQVVEIRRGVLGEAHPDYAQSLNNLAFLHRLMGDYAKAEPLHMQARDVWKRVLSEEHPDYATSLNNLAGLYESMGDYAKAEPLHLQAQDIRKRVLGEEHPDYAASLNNLAGLYESMGDYAKAEPLHLQARDVWKRVLGEEHPHYARSLNNLAGLYQSMGDYAKAEALFVQARDIRKRALGEEHPDYARSLNNLALLYQSMGDYAKAEPLYLQARDAWKRVLGEEHPDYATSLNNLAKLYISMGEYAKAEPLFVQARDIKKRVLGEEHPDYATNLNNLARLFYSMGDYAKAEPLLVQARDVWKRVLGDEHPYYAQSLNNLAALYTYMGDYAKAEPLFVQARDIKKRVLGEEHPDYASSLNGLALLYKFMGDYAKAEPLYAQARDIRKRVLGEEHPDYAASLNNLALLYHSTGDLAKAEAASREALEIKSKHARETALCLPEARAVSFLRELGIGRDPLLSVLRHLPETDHRDAYLAVWQTRGLVTRIQGMRRRTLRGSPETKEIFSELQSVQQRLAQLTLAVPKPKLRKRRQERLAELNDQKERLENDLAQVSAVYRRTQQVSEATPVDLVKTLPAATAIVDIIGTPLYRPPAEGEGKMETEAHYEAFVVRTDQTNQDCRVAWIHLGPSEPIDEAIGQWRQAIRREVGRSLRLASEPVAEKQTTPEGSSPERLRKLVWDRLEPHLKGIKTVIIIPDEGLTRLPWTALPGREPDSYLLEDYAIATAENGQQLYARLTEPATFGEGLLAVGGVAYDENEKVRAAPGSTRSERTQGPAMEERPTWDYLEGTAKEAQAVKELWASSTTCTVLSGARANETSLRQIMPNSRYIHLATHGFFADDKFRSMFDHDVAGEQLFGGSAELVTAKRARVTVRNPLLLSGIVLAGANLPSETDELGLPTGEDGIMTAEEVVNLDLRNTDLVILSACETGLGKVAGGEGVYGLTRAFGLAGARTTIASLWKVSDAATQALMTEFYTNLWSKKMGKLEALRQAQLAMIRGYDPKDGTIRGLGSQSVKIDRIQKEGGRLDPYYWAAFQLNGDWR